MYLNRNRPFDELQWVIQIRRIIDNDEVEVGEDQPISIFEVPKPLLSNKPDAYAPQLVAIGPYHHCREDLQDMERCKLSAARRIQARLPSMSFEQAVTIFGKVEHRIRAHYHRHLNLNGETLAWMMAIDASFLLEFLQIYTATEHGGTMQRIPSSMIHFVDSTRRTSAHNMILRDIVMQENQIPLFLPQKILEVQYTQLEPAIEILSSMLIGFLREISPFKKIVHTSCIDTSQHAHLLEFLYCNIVPKHEEPYETTPTDDHDKPEEERFIRSVNRLAIMLTSFVFERIRALLSVIIKFIVKIPLRILTNIPPLSIIKMPIEETFFCQMDQTTKIGNATVSPLLEEIAIPSVTKLAYAGIKLSPTKGDLSTIEFNVDKATLHLPVISLDVNTDVVLRNLVSYEASVGSRPLFFARYIELMNGIIDTEEDAKILREKGIIMNHLKSDKAVAELWNGMTRSIRLTRVARLDKLVEDVSKYYYSRWRVKMRNFVRRSVKGYTWDCVVLLVVILLFFGVGLQAFCVAQGCIRVSSVRNVRA